MSALRGGADVEQEGSRLPVLTPKADTRRVTRQSIGKRLELIERKPGLGNEPRAAPVRDQAIRVGDEIDEATRPRIWIACKAEAVFLGQVGVVVAQIEVEGLVGEGHARLPIEIGR